MKPLIAGTRKSDLAMWQTQWASKLLQEAILRKEGKPVEVALCPMVTRGDKDLSARLAGKLEKGFFTQELEAALRSGDIDFAVHSLKDLPTRSPEDLCVGAVLPRAPVCDWLIAKPSALDKAASPERLPLLPQSRVGSSSVRREALLLHFGNALQVLPLRGNVPTRLEKLCSPHYEAIVVAAAGLLRLEATLSSFTVFELNPRRWTPAPGQGAVAIQCRTKDAALRERLQYISEVATQEAVELERAYLRALEGGCTTPFGCWYDGSHAHLGLQVHKQWHGAHFRPPRLGSGEDGGPWDSTALLQQLEELNMPSSASTPPSTPREYNDELKWLYREA
ncbi:MAG: hydroxymethylbilane synthase [Cystobacterineae bacterium]|nr:hydroxymethylbilane synthase [Cystobacterineae bacterium]